MALIKCPECGKEVSDQADACIHCGYPLKKAATPSGSSPSTHSASSTPRCPTCGSTNVVKISNINRGVSVAMWGMMSIKNQQVF